MRESVFPSIGFFRSKDWLVWQHYSEGPVVPPAPKLPVVRSIDSSHSFATWDRVLIQMWTGVPTIEMAQKLLTLVQNFIGENPKVPLCSLSIVGSRSPPPSDKVRAILSSCYRALGTQTNQQIFVAEGSGFRAALVRGVGLTVSTLAPSLLPMKFAVSVDEAARLIAPQLSPASGGADGLKAAVDVVRGQLEKLQ